MTKLMHARSWMPRGWRLPLAGVLALTSSVACGPAAPDDDGNDDVGDGDGNGDGDIEEFHALCELGCAYFIECAPAEFGELYTSTIECQSTCVLVYGACQLEATSYFECFLDMTCADVLLAVSEGPGATVCGPAYTEAQTACDL